MSSLHHENILEDCFEVAMESFRINNKLTHEQLDELLSFSKGTYDAICNSAWVNLLLILKDSIATSKQSSKILSWCKDDIIKNEFRLHSHYNRKATKIYKYVDMNIFVNFLLYLIVFSILYVIMEAEPKIFLNLLQFITIILQ